MTHRSRLLLLLLLSLNACGASSGDAAHTPTLEPLPTLPVTTAPVASPVAATPTATLAPAPREFTEEFNNGAPHWTFLQAGAALERPNAEVDAGFLQIPLDASNQWVYALYQPHRYADVRVEALVEFGAGGTGAPGLICRYDPKAGWYEFNIYSDGTYALLFGQWLAEGVARYAPLAIDESGAITPAVNELALVCQGNVLTAYINQVQLRKRQETLHVLSEGEAGVAAASFTDGPLVILFDRIAVGEP